MYSSRWEWPGGDSSPQRLSRHWTRGDGKTFGLRTWEVEDVSGIALSPKMILLIQVHLCLTASLGNLSSSGTTIGLVSLTTKHKVVSKTKSIWSGWLQRWSWSRQPPWPPAHLPTSPALGLPVGLTSACREERHLSALGPSCPSTIFARLWAGQPQGGRLLAGECACHYLALDDVGGGAEVRIMFQCFTLGYPIDSQFAILNSTMVQVSRSIDARKRKASLVLVQGRSLAFGPVEEVPVQRYNSMIMILVWWSYNHKIWKPKQRTYQSLIYLVPKITVCKHENRIQIDEGAA